MKRKSTVIGSKDVSEWRESSTCKVVTQITMDYHLICTYLLVCTNVHALTDNAIVRNSVNISR